MDEAHLRPDLQELLHTLFDVSGTAYFQKLTGIICASVGADIALVGQLVDGGSKVQTLGLTRDGKTADAITYSIAGTPCFKTIESDYCLHRDRVQQLYPDDQALADERIRGYAGYALRDENGEAIGTIVALFRNPISANNNIFQFAKLAAARARVEMRHFISQENLKEALSESLLLNYSKSMFMASISHELRNPLSAMIGYASLIRNRQVDADSIGEFANEICTAGDDLLALIGDILSLATLEIASDLVERNEFDLVEVARASRRLHLEQAAAKNLTLLPLLRTEPLIILGDSKHTKKAILNLLSNAVKYTGLGEIEISVHINEAGEPVLSVQDTGVGMTAAQIVSANQGMDSFKQAYSMHQDGGGLGLPLTHLLMERQGGRMEIKSATDQKSGTLAQLVFPKDTICKSKLEFI